MLIEFRVENHRSLRDEQVLTMEAGRSGVESDRRPRQVPGHPESLLPVVALYGANASGKSNVLDALGFMREAVVDSYRAWRPMQGIDREPFAWRRKREDASLFEVSLLLDTVRYQYGFLASDDGFLEEWLHAWPNGKKQVWFERDSNLFKFGDNLKGENRIIEKMTRPNALFLSTAVQLGHQQLQPVFDWFNQLRILNLENRRLPVPYSKLTETWLEQLFSGDDDRRQHGAGSLSHVPSLNLLLDHFRTFIKASDVGIVDFKLMKSGVLEGGLHWSTSGPGDVFLKHQGDSDAWLRIEEESKGTQTLFHLALPILHAVQTGGTILIDELESSLHPAIAQKIVQLFNDPVTNPRNAQLIFTTHDTNLLGTTLGEPALRRDQVWLTEKDNEGATVLYPLSDYKPRKAENLERGYLQGRYGAIPFLGDFTVAGE